MIFFVSYTFQSPRGSGNGNVAIETRSKFRDLSWPEFQELQRAALSELRKVDPSAHSLVVNWWKILRKHEA